MQWISDYNSFWDSFWAGLFSGTIYSIFVGLIVGIILWRIQVFKEKSDTKVSLESEYYSVRQKIWYALKLPEVKDVNMESEFFLPRYLLECSKIINEVPVWYWEMHLKTDEQKFFLSYIKNFQEKYAEYRIASINLDTVVTDELKDIYKSSTDFKNEYKYFLGRINQISHKQLSRWLEITNESDQSYNTMSNQERINKHSKEYRDIQHALKMSLEVINSDIAKGKHSESKETKTNGSEHA